MAGMTPLHTKGREAAVAIVAYAFKQLMRAELRRHIGHQRKHIQIQAHTNTNARPARL